MRNTTVDSFRRKTVTVHYSSNRTDGKETGDEGTERRMTFIINLSYSRTMAYIQFELLVLADY